MFVNKAIIFGNITRDPELKSLPSGLQICSFSVATNRTWKNKDGEKQEQADFHNIVAFGKTAENIHQYMRKGSSIYIEGRIQTRSWEDKESGKRVYRTEIVAENVQFGPKKVGAESRSEDSGQSEAPTDDINPDDVPF